MAVNLVNVEAKAGGEDSRQLAATPPARPPRIRRQRDAG
jgi:hypothetical protein